MASRLILESHTTAKMQRLQRGALTASHSSGRLCPHHHCASYEQLEEASEGWEGISEHSYYSYFGFLAILVVPVAFLGWYCLKKRKQCKGRQSTRQSPSQEDVNYVELNLELLNVPTQAHNTSTPLKPSEDTVYSGVRHGT